MNSEQRLVVRLTSDRYAEKEYVFRFVFEEYLGLNVVFLPSDTGCVVELPNAKQIVILDCFFSRFQNNPYWEQSSLPQTQLFITHPLLVESDIPVLYGTGEISVSSDCIVCGIDIVASIFFMLTRWEEYANPIRDKFGRFPLSASVAYKWGFYKRPIVNEYIEMLWGMMVSLGFSQPRKLKKASVLVTHDVDDVRKWDTPVKCMRSLVGDIVVRRSLSLFFKNLVKMGSVFFEKSKDPYDTFDYLMETSEAYGLRSHFFFMAGGVTEFDKRYLASDSVVKMLMRHVSDRGHEVGIHPSFDTFNNSVMLEEEIRELRRGSLLPICYGRQHYLRFQVPTTWQIWDDVGMEWDSTVGYAEMPGFRAGICEAYPTFNFLTGKSLGLREVPLIVMDVSLTRLDFLSVQPLLDVVLRYKGVFVFLWHNSNFDGLEWVGARAFYEKVLSYMSERI